MFSRHLRIFLNFPHMSKKTTRQVMQINTRQVMQINTRQISDI